MTLRPSGPPPIAWVAALIVVCGPAPEGPTTQELPGEWRAAPPMPTARQEMPSALLGDRIYTPGGFDDRGRASTVMEVYDVGSERWSAAASLPEGRHHPGVAAAAGRLYVIGGYAEAGAT